MPSRYEIITRREPGRFPATGKYRITRGPGCINCGKCIELCIYGVHFRNADDCRRMAEPDYDRCRNCFACVQDCTANVLAMDLNPAYAELGDSLYQPDLLTSLTQQAETGTIPVLGGGYGGAFAGDGFDAMWTDLSEIVRPTRDGIHGRETISTAVDLGRHPLDVNDLRFDDDGNPITNIPPTFEIKLPILFDRLPFAPASDAITESICAAASRLGTLALVDEARLAGRTPPGNVVQALARRELPEHERQELARRGGVIEIEVCDSTGTLLRELKNDNPDLFVFVRVPIDPGFEDVVERLARNGVEVIHLDANPYRNGSHPEPRGLPAAIAAAHQRLVEQGLRDTTTLIASGGILQAEHVAKAIILGADAVAVDVPALIALECTVCKLCMDGEACPRELERIDVSWGTQRIINLTASWRNQLLEVLGAMGIRDVSRLRGETGRAIFKQALDREVFEPLFGHPVSAPPPDDAACKTGTVSSAGRTEP